MSNSWLFTGRLVLRALAPAELLERESDSQLFELREPFVFSSSVGVITVPAGFISDFASVPRAARWYVDDDDPAILFGSIVHDWIYSQRGAVGLERVLTREQADQVLREAMEACGARARQRLVVFWAVRLGGGSHWNSPRST